MIFPQPQLLLVDDSPLNLKILMEFLPERQYRCTTAQGGQQAWNMLEAEPDRFHAVLLDRIMPGMDGMEVLHKMKQHEALNQIPVIMQTAATTHQQTLEGLQAGAYYYLAKPFDQATLQAIVDAAVRDHVSYLDIRQDLRRTTTTMRLLESGTFHFRTPEEARNLAMLLAHAYPDAFMVLKFAGIGFILWLAWRTAFGAPVDLLRREPPPRRKLFVNGVGLQILNPNALVYFGIALPSR